MTIYMAGSMKMMYILILLIAVASVAVAFQVVSSPRSQGRRWMTRISSGNLRMLESEYDDYDDFLNLDKPIKDLDDEEKIRVVRQEVSILPPLLLSDSGEVVVDEDGEALPAPPRTFLGKSKESSMMSAQRKWPNWDSFMEDEFGDLDAELSDEEAWMWEARNAVEAKRGFAIWSQRSASEIKKEVAKSVAAKTLNIPRSVATIIRAVHLERTHTMKQIRKENELAAIEYRKWMIESRQKTKKDPLPQAKAEVVSSWLGMHPTGNVLSGGLTSGSKALPPSVGTSSMAAGGGSAVKSIPALAPFDAGSSGVPRASGEAVSMKGRVVMDEYTLPLRDTTFSGSGGFGGKIEKEKKEANNVVVTASMKLWALEREDMPVPKPKLGGGSAGRDQAKDGLDTFFIDDEVLYVPSAGTDDFYVVL